MERRARNQQPPPYPRATVTQKKPPTRQLSTNLCNIIRSTIKIEKRNILRLPAKIYIEMLEGVQPPAQTGP